jgi:hypothetical protein
MLPPSQGDDRQRPVVAGAQTPSFLQCEDDGPLFQALVAESVQRPEWARGERTLRTPARQRLGALPRLERRVRAAGADWLDRVRAAGADSGYQRPLSCLRSDELQASSFAGASEDAISSS